MSIVLCLVLLIIHIFPELFSLIYQNIALEKPLKMRSKVVQEYLALQERGTNFRKICWGWSLPRGKGDGGNFQNFYFVQMVLGKF